MGLSRCREIRRKQPRVGIEASADLLSLLSLRLVVFFKSCKQAVKTCEDLALGAMQATSGY
jgi:hypothetical protein